MPATRRLYYIVTIDPQWNGGVLIDWDLCRLLDVSLLENGVILMGKWQSNCAGMWPFMALDLIL